MPEAPADLPAAHSMDTAWFAVDGNGHVGVFESWETGDVPEVHFEQWDDAGWDALLAELIMLAPLGGPPFATDELWKEQTESLYSGKLISSLSDVEGDWSRDDYTALVELEHPCDPSGLAAVLPNARLLDCAEPLVYVRSCELGDFFGAWGELGIAQLILDPYLQFERLGVYVYRCRSHYGPYTRDAVPLGAPLRVESLATSWRRRLAELRFDAADFSRDVQLAPSRYVPTRSWGE